MLMVGMKGLEPSRLTALVPKTSVYTNFTTSPRRSLRFNGCILAVLRLKNQP
jgi:hypothetical protein